MNATISSPTVGIAGQATSTRVVSIDIFRGITMAVMIFVNDLASVHGLSKWTYHMPAKVDAMTYVDMVFPAFLFIVGMALPIAVKQRLKRNASLASLWMHVVLRAIALLVLGLILANAEHGDRARMHIAPELWALLGLAGAILLWNVYSGLSSRMVLLLRSAGAALIIFMFAIFRRSTPGGERWINFSYPEILGLIGLTYFAVCLIYIPTRRWRIAPVLWLIALVAYNVASVARWLPFAHVPMYIWPFGNGAMPTLVMAGVVTSSIFLGDHRWTTAVAEDTTGAVDVACMLHRGLAACTVRHLKDSRYSNLGTMERRCQLRAVHRTLLDLRCAQAHALGVAGASCRFQYVADVSRSGYLLLPRGADRS